MFNILTDGLPRSVTVDGVDCPINWEFQCIVDIEILLQDASLSAEEREVYALLKFYRDVLPDNLTAARKAMHEFRLDDKPMTPAQLTAAKKSKIKNPPYSFEHDSDYIFAAFMQQYRVNLNSVKELHWFEFRAMLNSLDDCTFTRIKSYRSTDLSKLKGPEKRRMTELKTYWALPVQEVEDDVSDDVLAALAGDGDLSKFRRG